MLTLPPSHAAEPPTALDVDEAMAEMEEKLPGMLGYLDYTDPGMHTTPPSTSRWFSMARWCSNSTTVPR